MSLSVLSGVYLQGLLLDGERKSIEPLSRRVQLPEGLTRTDPEQTLQQFVNPSPWDHQRVLKRYRAHLAQTFASPEGLFLFDDVSFPKPGTHSVGVPRLGGVGPTARIHRDVRLDQPPLLVRNITRVRLGSHGPFYAPSHPLWDSHLPMPVCCGLPPQHAQPVSALSPVSMQISLPACVPT